jgi:bifunctional DNA-binding transcriptional regulator/antitoxin component of YhaV-PrlF toxin-antitoxin module
MSESERGTTVAVTSDGQVPIPAAFRERLGIDTPGRVQFVENERGEVVIQSVERPVELLGALASEREGTEQSATELLREERG